MSLRWLAVSLLGLMVVISAIGMAWSRHQHRSAFAQLSQLERARDELNIEFDRLQIEVATLADTGRIEQQASTRLGMRYPEAADIVLVKP
jgi:cell division protein FtsL